MKKLIILLILSPCVAFGEYNLISSRRYTYTGAGTTSFSTLSVTSFASSPQGFEDAIFSSTFNKLIGFSCTFLAAGTPSPNLLFKSSSSYSIDYPFRVLTNDTINVYYDWGSCAPNTYALYSMLARLYLSGYRNYENIYTNANTAFLNFIPSRVVSDVISGTNTLWRSSVLSSLSNINNTLSGINTSINNINVDLGQFQTDYQTVNFVSLSDFNSVVDNYASQGYIDQVTADYYKSQYNSLSGDSKSFYASSVADLLANMQKMSNDFNWMSLPRNSNKVDNVFSQMGNSFGAGAAAHYITPLTNEMRRMTTDWADETKAALSNNTQKIKDDLAAWKNQLHGTQTSIDNSAANINNTLNNIAGGSSVVRVNVQNQDIGVTITDPVTIDPTQFNAFSEDLGKAGDYMERLFNEFKWWAWDSPDSWKKGYLDRDLSRISSNVQEQVSLQHSISNLLADFASNFTNNTEFAISNALAGFTFSSTNDYLLLSDYADYINTSGLSDLLGFLDDDSYSDLKDELSSIGADDVSSGYGRWWRYYTGLSTIQANSVFKIANLLFDHEKLLKDLKRENTDVVELSDSNVFSELLSKIPSQTHIDNKISELTNSIDQSGFARIRELIPDLTNRLSVASALYDHDFSLPTDISWVLIPGDSDLNIRERVIHISPSEHYRVFQVLHYGIAFSYCLVNLILLPKFLLLLVRLFDRVWNKSERLIYNSTQS